MTDKLDEGVRLMLEFKAGSEASFDQLLLRYQDVVFAMLRRILGPDEEVNDLAQETFIRIYRAKNRYSPSSKFTTFLYRIAYNLALNKIRDKKRQRIVVLPESREGEQVLIEDVTLLSPWEKPNRVSWQRLVDEALQKLPRNQRAALVLQHYDSLDLSEISEVLEVSPQAVKSLLHRARESLRELLGPYKDAEKD